MKKTTVLSLTMSIMLTLHFYAGAESEKTALTKIKEKSVIAVSIVPQKTFAEAVCGDLATVIAMIPPGNSPANYEPTPKEMEQFSKAQLYFALGVPAESANILPKAAEIKNLKIVRLQDDVKKVYADREFAPGKRDPHIWLSPKRVKVMIQSIAREMSLLDSPNKDTYEKNAAAYIEKLDAVDMQIQKALEGVKNRKFIVFHPAFGYLADDYNLQMFSLEKDGKEATPQRMIEMTDMAKKEKIKVIFYQAEISSKQAQAFAEEIGGKTVQLAPLAPNYIDNFKSMADLISQVMK